MSTVPQTFEDQAPRPGGVNVAQTWERVWQHEPSDARDNALLARERNGPRWNLIEARLHGTFQGLKGLRSIELGSGRGDLSVLLAERGADVTLLDRSHTALAQAQRRFDRLALSAARTTGDLLEPRDEHAAAFDVALSSGVIEHFRGEDRFRSIRGHLRVLRPGGLAIISVPHAMCLPYRVWKAYLECRGWWPYGMELPYTRGELTRLGLASGFARVEVVTYGFWQSVGDHLCRTFLHRNPDWIRKPSCLDKWFGATAVLFAWRDTAAQAAARRE